ncbi:metallophosphoesterase family protein [Hartmannibacter diazotrophicus]|nr:DNA repair exonuclease [Hartmannibacter diazotrophicus]
MSRFRFLHAADLHLDSPLTGLSKKSADFAARVDDASRRAFDALIELAIAEDCAFVLIAGDVFDGEWRHYSTGVYFASRMRQLAEHGIQVFLIFGNHDAENKFLARLDLSGNVRRFGARAPETMRIAALDVAIHGQSFAKREVLENLAANYPAPIPGAFNIGLLHTACSGREGHASYAPCSVEELRARGYDYWALGHIHQRELLCETPPILFPGNLQGRNPRETGPKGATLVTVEDGRISGLENRELDVLRFERRSLDASDLADMSALRAALKPLLADTAEDAAGRPVALRLAINGASRLHGELVTARQRLSEEIETQIAAEGHDIWLEKLTIETQPEKETKGLDAGLAGHLQRIIADIAATDFLKERLDERLAAIESRLPDAAHRAERLAEWRERLPGHAVTLAAALLEEGTETGDTFDTIGDARQALEPDEAG